jgi:hypothetical protein
MKEELLSLWRSLHDAEYLHLVLEGLLPFGLAAGVIFLAFGLGLKDLRMRWCALLLICLTGLSVWPAASMRQKALPRTLAMTEEVAFHKLMKDQVQRRASWSGLYYATAGLALLGLLAGAFKKGAFLVIGSLVLSSVSSVHALWLHKKECEVFHRNIVKLHAK